MTNKQMFINGKVKIFIPPHLEEVNQCPSCGEIFSSFYAFDYHRTGEFNLNRRCLTVDEMLSKKMGKNRHDRWVSKLNDYQHKEEVL